MREEGSDLHEKGELLHQDRRTIEAGEAVKVGGGVGVWAARGDNYCA